MPQVCEEYERLKWLVSSGKGHERCTAVVLVRQEAKKRVENAGPKPKTRFIFETDSAAAYSELNREKDRVIEAAGNKSIGVSLLIRAWAELDEPRIKAWMAEGEEHN
jgi:hypothetical protein